MEGGTKTLQSFVDAGLWDEARVEKNPRLLIKEGIESPDLNSSPDKIESIDGNVIVYYRNQNG